MRVLVTGADGFIGRNLSAVLAPRRGRSGHSRDARQLLRNELGAGIAVADVVVHLAGTNRPRDEREFAAGKRATSRDASARRSARPGGRFR